MALDRSIAIKACVVSVLLGLALAFDLVLAASGSRAGGEQTKTERFDRDPGWDGVNHRIARQIEPVTVRQDFGFSRTARTGGEPGEIGGFITAAGEPAYYAKRIEERTFEDRLRASGTLASPDGSYHVLIGFFRASTVKEWRTPSSIAIRLNGRGDHFFAYVEYATAKWRAGGDTTPFPSRSDPETGRTGLVGYPSGGRVYPFTLEYDPEGNGGRGVIVATIGEDRAVCELAEGHKADGATFDRFGILNVVKSADDRGELYFDDLEINGAIETFDVDPEWEGIRNREVYETTLVRPRFDFGFSPTRFAGGLSPGELGGRVFRGDCRYPERMAAYGDVVGPLTFDGPIRASGKIALARGVSDSTTLFGFYSSKDSLRRNDSQKESIPESVLGIHIEGPSSEGFCFYPVLRPLDGEGRTADVRESPRILPDGASHDFSLEYDPAGAGGKGRITVSLDGRRSTLDLEPDARKSGTRFDRFGIVTSWIDGNSQDVYLDDITYTVGQAD